MSNICAIPLFLLFYNKLNSTVSSLLSPNQIFISKKSNNHLNIYKVVIQCSKQAPKRHHPLVIKVFNTYGLFRHVFHAVWILLKSKFNFAHHNTTHKFDFACPAQLVTAVSLLLGRRWSLLNEHNQTCYRKKGTCNNKNWKHACGPKYDIKCLMGFMNKFIYSTIHIGARARVEVLCEQWTVWLKSKQGNLARLSVLNGDTALFCN